MPASKRGQISIIVLIIRIVFWIDSSFAAFDRITPTRRLAAAPPMPNLFFLEHISSSDTFVILLF
jgi:hypothetical protein